MLCKLIDFALAVPKLLMSKVFAATGISNIEFNFSDTDRVNGEN